MLILVFTIYAVLSSVSGQAAVGFSAAVSENQNIGEGEIVKFTKVYTNNGNAYSSSTGVFTASKPGLYFFTVNALTQSQSSFRLQLYHNDDYIFSVYGSIQTAYVMGGNSILLRLRSRDRVYVKSGINSKLQGGNDQIYTIFSGFLVAL